MKRITIAAGWILAVISLSTCAFLREIVDPADVMALMGGDTTPPKVAITSHTNGQEVGGTWMLQGTASDEGLGISFVNVRLDNGDQIAVTVNSGRWSYQFSTSVFGVHTNYVVVQDKAGNSASAEVWLERTSIPAIVVQSPFDGQAINSNTFVIQGIASADSPYMVEWVQLSTNGSAFFTLTNVTASSISWNFPMTGLVDGSNYIIARTSADNGKTNTTAQILLQVDISAPTFVIVSPSGTVTIESNSYVFSGTASDSGSGVKGVYLSLNGSAYHKAGGTTNWSTNLIMQFTQGTNTILLYAQDWGGSTSATNTRYVIKQTRKFTAYDAEAGDKFGQAVDVSGDGSVIVSSTCLDDIGANTYQGSAYVFRWSGTEWLTNHLIASDGTNSDQFGISVAMSGDGAVITVGASGANDSQGAVYVYKWNGSDDYIMTNKLIASDGATDDYFGASVAVSGDGNTVAAGAPGNDVGVNSDQGSVYVYKWNGNGYVLTNKLTATDGTNTEYFGYSVGVSGDGGVVVVGAYFGDAVSYSDNRGSAYVYKWNGSEYIQSAKLTASDGLNNDYFGYSVSLSEDGNVVAVGVKDAAIGANSGQGAVYVYNWNGSVWLEKKLVASDGEANDNFGYSVALPADGNQVIIGSYKDDDRGDSAGAVYRFYREGSVWLTNKILASDGTNTDYFGSSVAISGDGYNIVSSATGDDDAGADSGSIYLIK